MSTTRRMVPPRHGGGTGFRIPAGAASALPAFDAGAVSVTHRTVEPPSGCAPGVTCGAGSSIRIVDRPAGVWPVTTRRIGFAISGEPAIGRGQCLDHFRLLGAVLPRHRERGLHRYSLGHERVTSEPR